MATASKPCASSASRIAATRPSIMSEGATTSAPARACERAAAASRSRVGSFATSPFSTMPQWPWSVYSHRHTSVITQRSGSADLIASTARCTTPFAASAPEPRASFWSGIPKSSTAGMPSVAHRLGLGHHRVHREAQHAGHRRHRLAHAAALDHEERQHQVVSREPRLAHHPPQRGRAAQPPQPRPGKRHAPPPARRSARQEASASTNAAPAGPLGDAVGREAQLAQRLGGHRPDRRHRAAPGRGPRRVVQQRHEVLRGRWARERERVELARAPGARAAPRRPPAAGGVR